MNAVTFPVLKEAASLQSEAREKALGLRELRYFLSVAQTGNLGRAAQLLNVSQPAISLQLRKLEDGLGTQLCHRHGRGVTLTAAGACLRDRLHTVLQLLASPLDGSDAEPPLTTISLAVTSEAGAPLVAPLASMFRQRWPEIILDIREGSGGELEALLAQRHVDLALLPDRPSPPELEVIPLLNDVLGLVAPVHSPLAGDMRPLSVRELMAESLILPERQHWLRRRLDHAAARQGAQLRPMLQVDSPALSKMLVRAGLGCTVLPLTSVQNEITQGSLAFRPVGHPPLTSTHVIAFHRAASNTLVASLATMVCEAVTALAEGGSWPGAELIKPDVRQEKEVAAA
jgi:LysR family transcriptional regulator, nitrogen assimilation regulatory protein